MGNNNNTKKKGEASNFHDSSMKNGGLSIERLTESFSEGKNVTSSPAIIKGTKFNNADSSSADTNSPNKSETK